MMPDAIPDTILIEGLEFYGFHGVPDKEQVIGHRYRVDVRLTVNLKQAAASDNVQDTVNYAEVAQTIIETGTKTQYRLVERLAEQMIQQIFHRFVQVQAVNLEIRKLMPPLNGIVSAVGVAILRQRDNE